MTKTKTKTKTETKAKTKTQTKFLILDCLEVSSIFDRYHHTAVVVEERDLLVDGSMDRFLVDFDKGRDSKDLVVESCHNLVGALILLIPFADVLALLAAFFVALQVPDGFYLDYRADFQAGLQ